MPLRQLLNRPPGELKDELQQILDAVVEGLCGVDAQGNITFCNEALLRMTGHRSDELIGNSLHDTLHHSRPDGTQYPADECPLRKSLLTRQPLHVERDFLWRKDGTCFPSEYWAHPPQQSSRLTASVVTILDITERERATAAIRTSEERFCQISNNIDEAFYLVDVIGSRLMYASPAFETITGRTCLEASERPSPWRDLAVPEHRERVAADYLRLLGGEETRNEYQIRHSDGSTRWIKDHAKPIRDANGQICMFVGVIEDITEIHETRDVLRQSEEKFRRILSSVPDVAWTSDRDRGTIYISPRVGAVLGYTQQEIYAGGASLRSGLIHPKDFGRVNKSYRALFENKSGFDEEYRIRQKDGAWIWIHDRSTDIHEENGVLYADGVFSDITARKRAEAELQWKTAFLEAQANSTIDGILVVDGSGQRLMSNQRFIELMQIPPEVLATKDDRAMLKHVTTLMKAPESFLAKIHHLYKHPNETSRDEIELKNGMILDRYSAPVIGKNGTHYGRIWSFRDITKRKRNEEMLRQFYTAVEQSPVSVVITDPKGDITYVNLKFTECTGYTPEEVLEKNPRILNSGHSSPSLFRDLWSTITQGHEWRGELCNKKKNGELYWEAATIRPIIDAKGAITHYLALKEDITERRRADQALKASEKRYRLLFERNLAGVIRTTLDGRVLECNQAAARLWGYDSPEEVLRLPVKRLYHQASDREALLVKLKSEKTVTNHEMRFRRKDGDAVWAIVNFSLVEDDSSAVGTIEGTLVDITARRRAERDFRLTQFSLEHASDAVEWIDPEAHIVYVNEAACRNLGCSREELLSLSIPDINPSFSMEVWKKFWDEIKTHGSTTFESQHKAKQGRIFPVEITANYLEFDGREYCFAFVSDITERKRAERELRLTQFSLEHASDAVEWIDPEARIVYVNEAECRALGRSREEILSLSIPDIDPLFPKDSWRTFWEQLKARGSMKFETQHKTKQGRVFPVEVTANYLEFDGREYCFAFASDITERKRAEKELRLTRSSLENTSDTLLWVDPQGRLIYANEAFSRSSGYSLEEILSLSIPEIDPFFKPEQWGEFWNECKARGSMTFEAHNKTKQGRVYPVEVTASYLQFDGQEYVFALARDISQRRELERELRQAQKLEGVGQLAAGIAHEINTPTQFVADNLTFLRDSWKSAHELLELYRSTIRNAAGMLPPEAAAALNEAERNCDLDFIVAEVPRAIDQSLDGAHRVAKIVRAMKEFSHPDSTEKTATDLNKAIESTITVARNEWKYVAEMVTELDETLPHVVCYPGDINQVVLNLLVNAAHAIKEKVEDGGKGQITVGTRTRGEFAEISIADTGSGIPEAIRTRIFDPFFTTKEVGKGTGQGLSLAHTVVVKKHSGKIWFETELGRGTTFFIDLPIKPPNSAKEN